MKEYNVLTTEKFKILKNKVLEDITLTPDNIEEKSITLPVLYSRYNNIYNSQLILLKNINSDRLKTYRKIYHNYRFGGDKINYRLDTKKEIESYVFGDDEYLELKMVYDRQTAVVDFLEKTLQNIQRMSFNISHYIEIQKFKRGVVN